MTQLLKKLGSFSFTVWISVLLMLLLIVSTVLESIYGTAFAQKTFYQAQWFNLFLSLLCVNIICATILRFPIRKYRIGFLITHIGIVGLLIGALITRVFGIDGQQVGQNRFHLIGRRSQRVGQQRLVGGLAIAIDGRFHRQDLIHFYLRDKAVTGGRQRCCWQRREAVVTDTRRHF